LINILYISHTPWAVILICSENKSVAVKINAVQPTCRTWQPEIISAFILLNLKSYLEILLEGLGKVTKPISQDRLSLDRESNTEPYYKYPYIMYQFLCYGGCTKH
jgi:hypothetical protein